MLRDKTIQGDKARVWMCYCGTFGETSLKEYLLSIFPLQGMEAYARVSCIALEETSTDCANPFTMSHCDLVKCLGAIFPKEETESILFKLDFGHAVQLPVSTDQARIFGFVPKVN